MRDSTSFFSSEQPVFYVFKDIDGSVYYFTPEQYAKMYSSHSLTTYEYLGQAMKKGGPLISGEQYQYDTGQQGFPMEALPMTPTPIESQPLYSPAEGYAEQSQEVQPQPEPVDDHQRDDIEAEYGEETTGTPETAAPEEPGEPEVDKLGDLFDEEEPEQIQGAQQPPESKPDQSNEVQGNGQQPPQPIDIGHELQEGTAEGNGKPASPQVEVGQPEVREQEPPSD